MSVFIGYPSFMAYQMMKGKKGNNDGFPSISGMIARYSALGLTNEQMATNPVWVDKTGNGHDLQMKNFAWSGMSGVGGYNYNFTRKSIFNYAGPNAGAKVSSETLFIEKVDKSRVNCTIKLSQFKCQLKVTGVTEAISNGEERLRIYSSKDTANSIYIEKDGIYDVDVLNPEDGLIYVFANSPQTDMSDPLTLTSPIAIEQLPFYPGFILGDGVDDFAVTEKELNFEDTYTMYTAFIPLQNDPIKNMIVCGKDYKKDFYINYGTQLVFYTANSTKSIPLHINQFTVLLCKCDKTTGVIKNLVTGESFQFSVSQLISNPGLYYLWRSATVFSYGKTAIAGQTICNGYFSTDEDDEKVLDWYKKQYPWLFPDQAWTVTGKTNEDEDRATIANITGNGNNLVLSNFGFAEGSGYNEEGEYAGYLVTDGVDDKIQSSNFSMGKDFTVVGEWKMLKNSDTYELAGINKYDSFILYNYSYNNRINVYIHSGQGTPINTDSIKAFTSTGLIYIDDFNNVEEVIPRDKTDHGYSLFIGYNNNVFTKLAFKNLAIYQAVLSKDDCIKAYNYLQTLKAK